MNKIIIHPIGRIHSPYKKSKEIPILALYEKDYWPNKLSTMIRGISKKEIPNFYLREYKNKDEGKKIIHEFLANLLNKLI